MHKNFLDALRGMAALSVVAQHLLDFYIKETQIDSTPLLEAFSQNVVNLGRFGVVLFFLLSGYLIPQSLLRSVEGTNKTLAKFGMRRFFRIYPAFWFCMLIAVGANWLYYDRTASISDIAINATMLPSLLHTKPVLGLYWTLSVELMFYFICASVFAANKKYLADAEKSALLSSVFALACAAPIFINKNFGTNIPEQYLTLHFSALFLGNTLRLSLPANKNLGVCGGGLPTWRYFFWQAPSPRVFCKNTEAPSTYLAAMDFSMATLLQSRCF